MPRQVCVLVAFAGVMCAAHAASAQSPWYIIGSAGALLRFDASASGTFSNSRGEKGPGTNTNTYDAGPVVNLGLGYRLPLGFRIEGELGYANYTTASASPLSTNGAFPALNGSRLGLQSGGNHDEYTATINAFYDLPIPGRLVPYIGTGIGVAHTAATDGHFAGPGGSPRFTENGSSATNAAILAEVGLTIAVSDRWALVPSYRFEHLFVTGNAYPNNANIFKLGVRYSF